MTGAARRPSRGRSMIFWYSASVADFHTRVAQVRTGPKACLQGGSPWRARVRDLEALAAGEPTRAR